MGEVGMITIMFARPMPSFLISGFGYALKADPHSSNKSENELARAFSTIFFTQQQFSVLNIFALWFPFL
jgi:hypothetical protein